MTRHFTIRGFANTPWLLLAITLVFFGPVFFGHQIFQHRDLFFFHYPLRNYWITSLQKGDPPFLNAAINGAQPLLANPNYAVFYPGNILYFILPFDIAWNWSLAGHVFWAALGMYWLTHLLGCDQRSAMCGGLTFAFGGPLLSALSYYNILIAASWMPWIAGLTIKSIRSGGRWHAVAAFALACQLLAGEPTVQMMTVLLMIGAVILELPRLRSLVSIAVVLSGGFLLACIQLIPTLAWLPETTRAKGLDFQLSAALWSLHPARLIELLVPNYYGHSMSPFANDFWGGPFSDKGYPYFPKLYAGWMPLLIAGIALSKKWGKAAACIMILGLALSFGKWLPGFRLLFDLFLPFQLVRYPEKFTLLFAFGLSLGTAIGLNEFFKNYSIRNCILIGLVLLLTVLFASLKPWPRITPFQETIRDQALLLAALSGIGTLLLLTLRSGYARIAGIAVPIFLLVDLTANTWDVPQTEPLALIREEPALLRQCPAIGHGTILHLGEDQSDVYFSSELLPTLFMHNVVHPLTGLTWGIHYGATDDIDRMGWLKASMRERKIHSDFPKDLKLMRESGIQFVVSLSPLNHPDLQLVKEVSLQNRVSTYVYRINPPAVPFVRWEKGEGKAKWFLLDSHHMFIFSDASVDGHLIVTRNALPGWSCEEQGARVELRQTTDGWLHIPAKAGTHQYELIYRPPGLAAGFILTAIGTILILGALVLF